MGFPSRLVLTSLLLAACGDDASPADAPEALIDRGDLGDKADRGTIPAGWDAKVATTWLHLDLGDLSGQASIWFEPLPVDSLSAVTLISLAGDWAPPPN